MRTRRLALAFAAVLVLAACSSDGKDRAGTATTVTDEHGVVSTDAGSSPNGPSPGAAGAGESPAATNASPGAAARQSNSPGGAAAPSIDGHVAVGQFAPALLRPDRSTVVAVELRSQDGAALRQASVDHLTNVLGRVTGKPVSVDAGPAVPGGAKDWSADELRAEADRDGTLVQGDGGSAVLRVLAVHGTFGGDTGVLGVSVRGDTAAIFVDQVEASGSVLTGSAGIESAVVTHEAGHLLGLVDLYLHTGRQDPDHPGHSTNKGSVMYWAVESSLVGDLLSGGPPQDFDGTDLADLATIRNGA